MVSSSIVTNDRTRPDADLLLFLCRTTHLRTQER